MGAMIASQGPTEGGGGSSMFFAHLDTRESCGPLTSTRASSHSATSAQPISAPSQAPSSHPIKAHSATETSVLLISFRGRKTVSRTPYGADVAVQPSRYQRLVQAADVDVYRSFLDAHMVAPDLAPQMSPGKHAHGERKGAGEGKT